MADLLPDALKALWSSADAPSVEFDRLLHEQDRLMNEYADAWRDALLLPGEDRLADSLFRELRELLPSMEQGELVRRWTRGDDDVAEEWRSRAVDPSDRDAVEKFYDQSVAYLFELMQWHTLTDDNGPLRTSSRCGSPNSTAVARTWTSGLASVRALSSSLATASV